MSLQPLDENRVFDRAREAGVKPLLRHVPESGSTNADLVSQARAGAPQWTVLVADHQTAGRGRHQRSWASPAGGLYASVLLRFPEGASPPTLIPLAAGLALADALDELAGEKQATLRTWLKWPNDLLGSRGKLAGILCETSTEHGEWWAVVGLGVNIAPLPREVAAGLDQESSSLMEEVDVQWSRSEVLAALLAHLAERYRQWRRDPAGLRDAYVQRSGLFGRTVRVRTGGGVVEGVAEDIGEIGSLRIREQNGDLREIHGAEGIEVAS